MNWIALDLETHPFRPGRMAPPIVCLQYAFGVHGDIRNGILTGNDIRAFLHETYDQVLEDPIDHAIVGSYAAYDSSCILSNYWEDRELVKKLFAIHEARAVHCTQVIERLLDIAGGRLNPDEKAYNLDALAMKYLNMDLDKSGAGGFWRLRYKELENVPLEDWPEEAVRYALDDPRATLGVVEAQMERAKQLDYTLPDAPEQAYSDFALALCSNWGMKTNEERVRAIDEKTNGLMHGLKQKLADLGLYSFHTPKRGKFAGITKGKKASKALQAIVLEATGEERAPRTPSGRISLEADMLRDTLGDHAGIKEWLEFVGLEKTKSTYINKMYEGFEFPIHTRFKSPLETGRLSSSSPNITNQPRLPGVRECWEARPGYVFISCDFNSQEMRGWAQVCKTILGWSKLAERYRQDPDFDPHTAMAAQSLLLISEEEALARLKLEDAEVEDARQSSKISNFGLPGMMGVDGLIRYARGYGKHWSEPETCERCRNPESYAQFLARGVDDHRERQTPHTCFAARLKKGWQETWPEHRLYFQHIQDLQGIPLIQLYSGRWRGHASATARANSYFQGIAADSSKKALRECVRRCYSVETSWLFGCRPVVLMHDEILAEAPEEYAAEAAVELKQLMEDAQNEVMPDVPARAGAVISKFWSKKAKARYDEGGRLIPWTMPDEQIVKVFGRLM